MIEDRAADQHNNIRLHIGAAFEGAKEDDTFFPYRATSRLLITLCILLDHPSLSGKSTKGIGTTPMFLPELPPSRERKKEGPRLEIVRMDGSKIVNSKDLGT